MWSLYDAELGWLDLNVDNGIMIEEFTPGSPEVRSVLNRRPMAHGFVDETRYFGERSISMSGKIKATSTKSIEDVSTSLKRYLLPNRRPVLRWTRGDMVRDISVRVARPLEQTLMFAVDDFRLELTADTFWRDTTQLQIPVAFSDNVALGGDPFPWLGGPSALISFAPGTVAEVVVTNSGDVDVYPLITVYGQVSGVVLRNLTTGRDFEIGVDVSDGSSAVIDMENHTATLNGLQNVFSLVDFAVSEWWPLVPGEQSVMFLSPTDPTGPTPPFATFTYSNLRV
jgi:hypothetical protein